MYGGGNDERRKYRQHRNRYFDRCVERNARVFVFLLINTLDFKSKLNMLELTNTFRTILYKKIAMRIRRELIGV